MLLVGLFAESGPGAQSLTLGRLLRKIPIGGDDVRSRRGGAAPTRCPKLKREVLLFGTNVDPVSVGERWGESGEGGVSTIPLKS